MIAVLICIEHLELEFTFSRKKKHFLRGHKSSSCTKPNRPKHICSITNGPSGPIGRGMIAAQLVWLLVGSELNAKVYQRSARPLLLPSRLMPTLSAAAGPRRDISVCEPIGRTKRYMRDPGSFACKYPISASSSSSF